MGVCCYVELRIGKLKQSQLQSKASKVKLVGFIKILLFYKIQCKIFRYLGFAKLSVKVIYFHKSFHEFKFINLSYISRKLVKNAQIFGLNSDEVMSF